MWGTRRAARVVLAHDVRAVVQVIRDPQRAVLLNAAAERHGCMVTVSHICQKKADVGHPAEWKTRALRSGSGRAAYLPSHDGWCAGAAIMTLG